MNKSLYFYFDERNRVRPIKVFENIRMYDSHESNRNRLVEDLSLSAWQESRIDRLRNIVSMILVIIDIEFQHDII
jgi:hypothetical protein